MDLYKMKWKAAFRIKKVQAVFKLTAYNLRHKLNMEGDDGFYYHLQRQLMRDLLRSDPEQEYLAEHGLLPEEPEEEKEPGLIRELGLEYLILSACEVGEATYMATELLEYEEYVVLKISRVICGEVTEYEFSLPRRAGERCIDFAVEGVALRFDSETLKVLSREAAQ